MSRPSKPPPNSGTSSISVRRDPGGRAASALRLVLAATLGASYGIYGPAFEQVDIRPLVAGREEYLNSEKYQVRHWDLDRPGSLRDFAGRVTLPDARGWVRYRHGYGHSRGKSLAYVSRSFPAKTDGGSPI